MEFLSSTKKVIEKIEKISLIKNDKIPSERIFKKEKKKQMKRFNKKKIFKKN